MQKRLFVFLVLIGLIALANVHFFIRANRSGSMPKFPEQVESATGIEEDPDARAKYEWMRLRDPKTGEIPRNMRAKELAFAETLPNRESLLSSGLYKSAGFQALTWQERGPFNIGGRTRALGIDVSNENNILAGGVSGGLWRSTDGGSSWTNTTLPSDLHSITCLAQDTRSGKTATWYYGTGEFRGNSASGGTAAFRGDGIFKSTNGGISWTLLPATATGQPQNFDQMFDYIWNIATDPSNSVQDELYAATFGGLRRSVDGGNSWSTVKGGFSNSASNYTDVAVTSTGVVYTTMSQGNSSGTSSPDQGIWRSTDGVNFTNITFSRWPSVYNRIVIGIAPSNQNVVYFLAETPGSGKNNHSLWKYTYLSGNGSGSGGSWDDRSNNLPAYGGAVGNFTSQGSYDLLIKVKPDNENVSFIGGTNLYRSTDGFATGSNTAWIGGYSTTNDVSLYTNHHPDQHTLVFLPSNSTVMISGHDGGLSKTANNLASTVLWTSLNNGYFTTQFYTVAIDRGTSGNPVIIGGMQDNGTWLTTATSATTPWINAFGGDGAYCDIADGRTSYYVSSQLGNAYRLVLNNNGDLLQWTKISPTGGSGYLFISPFVLDPNDSRMMYLAGGDRVWRNSDLTAVPLFSNSTTSVNWIQLTNTSVSGATITALGMSKNPPNRLYYGTLNGRVYRLDGANDGNPSPTDVWTGKGFPAGAYVSCIAVEPSDANKALVVFSNYNAQSLFYTINGGTNWTAVSGNLEQNPDGSGNGSSTRWVGILPLGANTYYFAGTSTGLYSTTTLNGASTVWALEGASNIGNVVVDMIAARQSDGLVAVATHGQGIYSATAFSTAQTIAVTAPAAGTNWTVGTNQTVSWSSTGVTGNVNIKLSTNNGTTFPIALASNTANDGTELVLVPNNPSTTCRVRVESAANPSVFGDNPGNFTIQSGTACALTWQTNIAVADAGNSTATLSFGQGTAATNGLDGACGEVELPPLPPTGVFDARFELPGSPSISSFKDYRNDTEQAINWRIKFQSGTAGAMTFFWNPANLPAGSFFLKDEIVGTLVNVDMKAQNSYTLTNTSITPLKIEHTKQTCRDVSVLNGWNLVSVPVLAANMSATSLFPDATSAAFGFNNGYVATTTLTNGKGYWMSFNVAKNYTICGAAVTLKEIPANAGWNIIGPFESDVPVSAITSVPAGIVISSYFGYNNGYIPTTTLNAGKGYWVRASQAGTLRLPIGSAAPKIMVAGISPLNQQIDNSWPRILVEDSDGKAVTLYLAPAKEISRNFELPPAPPAGVLDVRFSSDRYVENLEGGRCEVQIRSAKFPIRIKAQNLKDRVFSVKDSFGGNALKQMLADRKEIVVAATLDKILMEENTVPVRYELSQNYPNPFNPTTVIRFAMPEKGHVRLTVYNIVGEKVAELVNQEFSAGYHQVELKANSYASGVYFYVMESGNFRDLKKMLIQK